MAKTGDAPDRKKAKAKPRARAARPSFAPAAAPAANPAWVYRSDAPAQGVAKPVAKPAVKPAARPVTVRAPRGRSHAPSAPSPMARSSRVTHALDVVTLPIAVSLMAVLAPMRWLLGPSRP